MSNDLISRKALIIDFLHDYSLLKDGKLYIELAKVMQKINEQPTAYDVDKVVEQLVKLRGDYDYSDYEDEFLDAEEIYEQGREQGKFEAYHNAKEIVKAGGIDEEF